MADTKVISKRIVFQTAGHFILIPYTEGGKLDFKRAYNSRRSIVVSGTRETTLNTLDLPDGNSPYPAKTYVQTQTGTVTYQLSTYDPELEALIAGAKYYENDTAYSEMWYNGDIVISEEKKDAGFLSTVNREGFSSQPIMTRTSGPAVGEGGVTKPDFDYQAGYAKVGVRLDLKTAMVNTDNIDLNQINMVPEIVHTIDGMKRAYIGVQFTKPDNAVKVKMSHTPDFEFSEEIDLTKEGEDVHNGQFIDYIGFAVEIDGVWEKMRKRSIPFYFQWIDMDGNIIKKTLKTIHVQGTVSYGSTLNPIPNDISKMQLSDQFGNIFEPVDSIDIPITAGHYFVDTDTGEIKFAAEDKGKTLYAFYSYYGENVATTEYDESPKMASFQAIMITETKDMDETTYQRANVIIDKCSVSGNITPPGQSNDPTGGWTLTLSIAKPRSGEKPIIIKFEKMSEKNSINELELSALANAI